MKIGEALEKFLLQLAADGRSPHTINQYRRHLILFTRWTAQDGLCRDLSEVDHQVVARFLVAPEANRNAHGGRKKATSVNCLRTSLKGFFQYLHRAGYIGEDPGRLIRRAVCGHPPPRTLSDDERQKLLDTLAQVDGTEAARDHVLFGLMLATGIRLSSAIALDVEDVDLKRGEIRLRSTKGNRPATVFLGKGIQKHLRKYLHDRSSGPLFPAKHGGRLSKRHAQRRFRELVEKAGIERPASPHSLRHDFATRLYQKTEDIFLVKEALHHRSIASTLVYAKPDEARLRRAMG